MLTEKCVKLNEVETAYTLSALVIFRLIYEGKAKILLGNRADAELYEASYQNLDNVIKSHPQDFPTGSEDGSNFQSLGLKMTDLAEKFLFTNVPETNKIPKLPLENQN